ncbi:flagellar biosynthesis protein FlhF [Clostridium sp. Cult2]|uniref:flagellar biosynthesis protein FlhF n=1 Tax=Clostridium sp. Cult2 TaxID=2079003 RepID=UPI001F45CD1D|nr:flagellar biosynthesis protein FlhF [Clostridium sp. Cult2]MCF6464719.1 flagellar biosynthesis protein FlhF [Clostridium sp. Cult2]
MKVKKYTGYTTFEAMTKLKRELGSEAIVLNTRTIRQKGLFGLFKKPLIEITAACEKKDLLPSINTQEDKLNKINNELAILRNMVEQISSDVKEKDLELSTELDKYRMKLITNGVEYITATSILKKLNEQINFENKDNWTIKNIIKQTLMEYIGQVKPLSLENPFQNIIFFVGPTGVGKTTTLAKIAAQLVMKGKYDIGLITSDTYRIAAIDQLKAYSDILQLPLEIIYDEEDMYKSLVTFKDKDIIFVDTAGKNHRDIDENDEIFKIMNSINNKEVFLVLSGTTEYNTLKSIIDHYSFIKDYKIIFTKIDESEGLGNILNVKYLTENPVSYITTGQNVPDDIEILDREKVVRCLIGEI